MYLDVDISLVPWLRVIALPDHLAISAVRRKTAPSLESTIAGHFGKKLDEPDWTILFEFGESRQVV